MTTAETMLIFELSMAYWKFWLTMRQIYEDCNTRYLRMYSL